MNGPLPQRRPGNGNGYRPVPRLSVGGTDGRFESAASSLLATCGQLRGLVADWEARAGLFQDRGDLEGAALCRAHADALRTVLNTGRR